MKKLMITLISMLSLALMSATFSATLSIRTSGSLKKADYLCIYDVGCFNLKIAASGRKFNVNTMNLTQLKKFVMMNTETRTMSAKDVNHSCNIIAKDNQAVTIHLNVESHHQNAVSTIKAATCKITG